MKFKIILAVLLVAIVGVIIASPSSSNPTSASSLTFQKIKTDVAAGGQLMDVRTAPEFTSGHIDGAINLSLQDIQAGARPTIAKTTPLYIYCHTGNRSSQATAILKAAGYTNIIDLGAITNVQALGGVIKT